MTEFNKEQALARHIHLSDINEEERKAFEAQGQNTNKATEANLAIGELAEEALHHGYAFYCTQQPDGMWTHTIERAVTPDYADMIMKRLSIETNLQNMLSFKLPRGWFHDDPEKAWQVMLEVEQEVGDALRRLEHFI